MNDESFIKKIAKQLSEAMDTKKVSGSKSYSISVPQRRRSVLFF
jgi:hypothetical protein